MKVPLIVIEDETEHFDAITECLSDRFDCHRFSDFDTADLVHYRASIGNFDLVIVDLNLGEKHKEVEGWQIIKKHLWPADRFARFVVFSQYRESINRIIDVQEVCPPLVVVSKELDGKGKLTECCLSRLRERVLESVEYCVGDVQVESFNAGRRSMEIQQFIENSASTKACRKLWDSCVFEPLIASEKHINRAIVKYTSFSRSGAAAQKVAVGIFGSCGRLEMRNDSDIEFVVLVDDRGCSQEEKDSLFDLGLVFWNQIARGYFNEKVPFEGQEFTVGDDNPFEILTRDEADKSYLELPTKYIPLISIDRLINYKLSKEPRIRDRHLQILTELKPVYNCSLVSKLKRDLILGSIDFKSTEISLDALMSKPYFSELLIQASIDFLPDSLENWKAVKGVCYRVMQLIALRLKIINFVCFEEVPLLDTLDNWNRFFRRFSDGGFFHLVQFSNSVRNSEIEQAEVLSRLDDMALEYLLLREQLHLLAQDGRKGDWSQLLRQRISKVLDSSQSLMDELKKRRGLFGRVKDHDWLFDVSFLKVVRGNL